MQAVLPAIALLPLGVFVVLLIGGAIASRRGGGAASFWRGFAGWLSVGGVLAATVLALLGLLEVRSGGELQFSATWFSAGDIEIPLSMRLDGLQALMVVVVAAVSTVVHLFSIGYMGEERDYVLYFAELSLFSGSMLLLVLADNFFLLYMGWELVGASSYLLISFYFQRPAAASAGKKAFLTTRLGDMGLLIGIFAIVWQTRSLEFSAVFSQAEAGGLGDPWSTVIPLLIFAGAVGKSAQFPLHVWLPDAMEGPTPVSALIHAATMVAAGVYLVARTFPIFEASVAALTVVAWIGGVTALGAATIGVAQRDIKRVLAYSTVSQLGFMMVALGAGVPEAGIFHLFTHAWFKALLFLGAGSVIHATGYQFVEQLGGLGRVMPITSATFTVGALALAGIPPFAGFWSKEEILTSLVEGQPVLFVVLLLATFLTAFYIFRLVFLVFFGPSTEAAGAGQAAQAVGGTPVDVEAGEHGAGAGTPVAAGDGPHGRAHESGPVMTLPLVILAVAALLAGFLGASFFGRPLQGFLALEAAGAAEHEAPLWVTFLTVGVGLLGIFLAWLGYGRGRRRAVGDVRLRGALGGFYEVVASGYRLDALYDRVLIRPAVGLARFSAFGLDERVIDGAVNGLARLTAGLGWGLRRTQSGIVRDYVALMAVGILILVAVVWRAL